MSWRPRQVARHAAFTLLLGLAACGGDAVPTTSAPMTSVPHPPDRSPPEPAATPGPAARGLVWGVVDDANGATGALAAVAIGSDGQAVAVGEGERGGLVAHSRDGREWMLVTDDAAFDGSGLTAIAPLGSGFVVAGVAADAAMVWLSNDGDIWQRIALPRTSFGADWVTDLAVRGERLVAVGSGAWYSDGGEQWQLAVEVPVEVAGGSNVGRLHLSPVGCGGAIRLVNATDEGFIAVGTVGCDARVTMWRSVDGREWVMTEPPGLAGATVNEIVQLDERIVAFGAAGARATAWELEDDDWVPARGFAAEGAASIDAVAAVGDGYAGVVDGKPWRSQDGLVWLRASRTGREGSLLALASDESRVIGAGSVGGLPAVWLSPPDAGARLATAPAPPPREVRGTWEPRAPMPVAGYVSATTGPDGQIYVVGGVETLGDNVVEVVQVYDPRLDRWQVRERRIGPISGGATVTLHDGRLVLVEVVEAGLRAGVYDVASGTSLPLGPPLENVHSPRATSVGGRLLVSGFEMTAEQAGFWSLAPDMARWEPLALPPGPVDGLASDGVNTVYAVSGSRMWAYDLEADTWTPRARKLTPRGEFAMVFGVDGLVWVIGGFTGGEPDGVIEAFDPENNRWLRGPDLPTPRMYPAAALASDGAIIVIGGSTQTGAQPGSVVEALRP